MADISKITLPGGTSYNIKDITARTDVNNEVARAKKAESDEVSRATAAEAALKDSITTDEGRISGLESNLGGHTVLSDVPANAKFTDNNTWRGIQDNLTSTSTTDSLSAKQGKVLKDLIDNLPDPMVFKGSLGTNGTITSLPTAAKGNTGFTYKVITAGTYASQVADVGDTFISDGSAWVLIPSGDEPNGTVTSIATSGAITGGTITTSGTISHSTASGYKHIPSGGSSGQYLKYSADGTAAWASPSTTSVGSASAGTAIAADDITDWSAGSVPTLGTPISADDITGWNAGSVPTLGTAIAADDITAWNAGSVPKLTITNQTVVTGTSVSGEVMSFTTATNGSASGWSAGTVPSLSYTARSIPNVTSVGSIPSLNYTARSIPNVTSVGTSPALTYTPRSIPNIIVTNKTVVAG